LARFLSRWHRVPGVTTFRRLGFPFWLTRARLARRGGRFGLVVLGVAAASAMLAAVIAGALAAQDRHVGKEVSAIDPTARSIRVSWFTVGGQTAPYATLNRHVRRRLRAVTARPSAATALYRESQIAGDFLALGAVDDLGRWVRVRSGRLPRPCTPSHCEVLVIRKGGRIPHVRGLRLVPVGQGDVVSATLFGDAVPSLGLHQSQFVQEMARYHRPAPPPLVLANGVAGLDRSPRLHDAYRTYSWVVPLDRRLVHSWSVASLVTRIEHARSELQSEVYGFDVEAPTDELHAAADSGRVVSRRLFLLGGEAVALLLAFAVLAGARLRPDVEASRQRLVSSGARGWQTWLQTASEAAAPALVGTVIGWFVGAAAAAVVASSAGEPVGGLLEHSVLSGGGIAAGLLLLVAAAVVLVATLAVRPVSLGRFSVTPLDVAAVGAVVAVAIALARGAADASALLSGNGTGVVLLLLPVLVSFAAAVVVARLLPPALRALERAVPRRALSWRLASLALARRPGTASVAVAFVVVSVGLALFAETYRWTLVRGQRDQAAFAVPADYVVSEDISKLVPVRTAVTPALARELDGRFVTRQGGNIEGAASLGNVAVLGLEPETLSGIRGWRSDFASGSPGQLARSIAWHGATGLRGARLPASATRLVLPVRVVGTQIGIVAIVKRRDGTFTPLSLGTTHGSKLQRLVSVLPPAVRGGTVVAFRFVPPPRLIEHGGDQGGPAIGTVFFGRPLAGDRAITDYADWIGTPGVQRLTRGQGIRFALTLTPELLTYLRPRQPTDGHALPAVVSPRLGAIAGRNGVFGVNVAGEPLLFRAVAVARRFPSATSQDTTDFVVADRDALVTALNASQPGAGFPTELWVGSGEAAVARRLQQPPFDVLSVASRAGLERRLRDDPVSRAAVAMLEVAALTALVLALVGLGLGVVAEMRDDAADLFDLEAQGLAPANLRRQLRLRALVVAVGGVIGGVLTALLLSALVVGFVELTANAGVPNPPLVLAVDWPVVLVAALVTTLLAAIVVVLVTDRAFRGATPERYG
jgi:hypothetical protein